MPISGFARDERGSIAIVAALCLVVLVGIVGTAVDYGRAHSLRSHMQAALDAAVLTAAQSAPERVAEALSESFVANGSASFAKVQLSGKWLDSMTIEGRASGSMPTSFLGVLGFASLPVGVTSVAKTQAAAAGSKVCVLVLDGTAVQSFLVNSGAKVDATSCEIHVKSKGNPASIFNASSTITTARICIEGSTIIDNGGVHPNLKTACATVSDPFAGTLPVPATNGCDFSNLNFNGGVVNLTPGVYCGWTNFNAAPTVTFAPGVYVIKNGGWNVNGGTWTGSGVTFYYADTSKIQFNSAVAASISAPTSGAYQGLFMYEAQGLPRSPFVLDDSKGFNVTDLIYLPSRDTTFNAASNLAAKQFTLVVNTLILDQTNWQLQPGGKAIASGGGGKIARLVK